MTAKIDVRGLFCIYGDSPRHALELLSSGVSKDEIREQTGNVVAVSDASFTVEEGEVFMVMGLSGSGKSTMIRCINRLLRPTAGEVYVDGEDILTVTEERLRQIRRSKMAMVFQHFALLPHKSVVENVAYGLKIQGVALEERRARAMDKLDMVGLREWAERATTDLSGGMQQRVGLARALATDPDILLMDEAFSALDPLIRREMQDELINIQLSVHKSILFITHDLHEALKLGDRIAVMKDGQIVQTGTPEEIVASPANEYVEAFTLDVNRGLVFTAGSLMRRAEAIFLGRDSVKTAMYHMRQDHSSEIYVLDRQRKPAGLITEREVIDARQRKTDKLDMVMRTDFPVVNESAPIGEVLPLCSQGVPIAVVNDKGIFRGELDPLDVLSNLATSDSTKGNGVLEGNR